MNNNVMNIRYVYLSETPDLKRRGIVFREKKINQ